MTQAIPDIRPKRSLPCRHTRCKHAQSVIAPCSPQLYQDAQKLAVFLFRVQPPDLSSPHDLVSGTSDSVDSRADGKRDIVTSSFLLPIVSNSCFLSRAETCASCFAMPNIAPTYRSRLEEQRSGGEELQCSTSSHTCMLRADANAQRVVLSESLCHSCHPLSVSCSLSGISGCNGVDLLYSRH